VIPLPLLIASRLHKGRRLEIKLKETAWWRMFGILPICHRVISQSEPEIRTSNRNMTGYRHVAASRLRAPQRKAEAFRGASLCESVSQNRRQQSQFFVGEDRQQPLAVPDPDTPQEHGDLCRLKYGGVRVPSRCIHPTGRRISFQLNERTVLLEEYPRRRSGQCTTSDRSSKEQRCSIPQGVVVHAPIIGYPDDRVYAILVSEKTEKLTGV
jgi:hypothetical protein